MRKMTLKKTIIILLKLILGIFLLIFIFLLFFGFSIRYKDDTYDKWSGLRAIFEKDRDFGVFLNQKELYELDGYDGPYLIGSVLYFVNEKNELKSLKYKTNDSLLVQVDNDKKELFYVHKMDSIKTDVCNFEMPDKLISISDIEGNFDAFSSFLKANKVIDDKYNWIFGNGHLVLNGDFVDRGKNVTQVLWLIYKIENQAKQFGGKVHYILGNHELLNFQGSYKYNNRKYVQVAKLIYKKQDSSNITLTTKSDYIKYIYSNNTELGKWLNTKNGIAKIGKYIFVHGGISPEIIKFNFSLDEINQLSRKNWHLNLYNDPKDNEKANFLIGRTGIFWYRGLASDYKYYDKINEIDLDRILTKYNSKKIVHGHTVVEDITKSYNGKVINIDVKHGDYESLEKTKGILIQNEVEYKIDAKGNKTKI
jgi:hypothetical protein